MITHTASTVTHERNHPPEGPYDIPFRFDEPSWLVVSLLPPAVEGGGNNGDDDEVPPLAFLAHGLDYTLAPGAVAGHTHLRTLLPVPEHHRLRIKRATPAVQHLDLIPAAPLPAKDLERSLDRIAMGIHDRSRVKPVADKALGIPRSEAVAGAPVHLVSHEVRKGTVLSFHPAPVEPVAPAPDPAPQTGDLQYVDFETLSEAVHAYAGPEYGAAAADEVILLKEELTIALDTFGYDTAARFDVLLPYDAGLKMGDTEGGRSNQRSLGIQTGRLPDERSHIAHRFGSIVVGFDAWSSGDNPEGWPDGGESDPDSGEDQDTISIGSSAACLTGDHSRSNVALGHQAIAWGYWNISLGPGGNSGAGAPPDDWDYTISHEAYYHTNIGQESYSHGRGTTAVGTGSGVLGWQSTAIGRDATAKGKHVLAIGPDASAMVPYEGNVPGIWETPALALGPQAATQHQHTVAIGPSAATLEGFSTAIGADATTTAPEAVAIGPGASTSAGNGVAIGRGAIAPAAFATVFGGPALGPGAWSSAAFGHGARLTSPRCAEITAAGDEVPGSRLLLQHDHGVALSYARTTQPPAAPATGVVRGSEPQDITGTHHGSLGAGMLTFHSDGTSLKIHISHAGEIRTATIGAPVGTTPPLPHFS